MNFPIIRYIVHHPTRRIVRVKIEKVQNGEYPFKAVSLEPVNISGMPMCCDVHCENAFFFADLTVLTTYKTRRQAEKAELEKLQDEYCEARSSLRKVQNYYKLKHRQLQDYKHFGELQKLSV
jgi:hypothetical protein